MPKLDSQLIPTHSADHRDVATEAGASHGLISAFASRHELERLTIERLTRTWGARHPEYQIHIQATNDNDRRRFGRRRGHSTTSHRGGCGTHRAERRR